MIMIHFAEVAPRGAACGSPTRGRQMERLRKKITFQRGEEKRPFLDRF